MGALLAYVGFECPHTPVLPPAEFREKFQKLKYEIPTFTVQELAAFPPQIHKLFENSQSDHFTKTGNDPAHHSNFALGADDGRLDVPAIDSRK